MGFVADAIGDIFGKVGNTLGFQGGANQFRSTAPVNAFHATGGQAPQPATVLGGARRSGQPLAFGGAGLGGAGGSGRGGIFGGAGPLQADGGGGGFASAIGGGMGSPVQDPGPYNAFNAVAPQNSFNAVAPQSGFQAQQANLQNTDFSGALQQSMFAQDPGMAVGQQQGDFANQLRAQIAGNGIPSLAQMQLQRALQQNQMQQAAAMGGVRGINPALASRLIGQQGAQMGQDTAAQAAMLRAQEQMNAQQMLGQALQAQRGQDILGQQATTGRIGTLGGLQQGQNALTLQNSMQTQGMNQATSMGNAQLAQGAQGMNLQAALANQQAGMGALGLNAGVAGQNASLAGDAQRLNAMAAMGNQQAALESQKINAGIYGQNANISTGAWGGLLGGVGSLLGMPSGKPMAEGGEVPSTFALDDPMSYIGIRSVPNIWDIITKKTTKPPVPPGGAQPYGADSFLTGDMLGGAAAFGGGGAVPGRAAVGGDSSRNDTVPIMASPGEVVLPRSVADDPEKSAAFVRALQRHERQKDPGGYGNVLAQVRQMQNRLKQLEAMCRGGRVR